MKKKFQKNFSITNSYSTNFDIIFQKILNSLEIFRTTRKHFKNIHFNRNADFYQLIQMTWLLLDNNFLKTPIRFIFEMCWPGIQVVQLTGGLALFMLEFVLSSCLNVSSVKEDYSPTSICSILDHETFEWLLKRTFKSKFLKNYYFLGFSTNLFIRDYLLDRDHMGKIMILCLSSDVKWVTKNLDFSELYKLYYSI